MRQLPRALSGVAGRVVRQPRAQVQRWQWRAGATMQDPRTIGHSQTKEVESGPATHHRVGLATKLRQVELRPWKPAFFWETNRQISPFRQNTGGEEERSASVQWPMDSTPEKVVDVGQDSDSSIFSPTPEHQALREMVRSFTEAEVEPQAIQFNRAEKMNVPLFQKLGELGLLGVTVPEEYGGSGMDATAAVIVHEELASSDPAFCLAYLAHSMLFVNNLAQNGNEAQKQRWLSSAVDGSKLCGMCMSEPSVGTDVLGMKTTAVKDGDEYVLNGAKMWITNGTVDGVETGDAYLVEASLSNQDCRVPASNLVGEEGKATLCMMRNLEIERVALAAMSLGIARRCVEEMNRYAKERHAFGAQLNSFGQIQRFLAESFAEYQAGRSYVYQVARNLKLDSVGNGLDADGVKLYCGQMGKNVADRAIQVMGGYGYVGEYNVERLWRDAKLLEIGGGTNEAHHKNIVRDLSRQVEKLP
eukprot:g18646.t1